MGISPHLADLFVQQEISRDVARAVERADLEGLLSEPDIQKFLRAGARASRLSNTRVDDVHRARFRTCGE